MTPTMEEIRARGLRALREELGQAGMIRFLQQFETGSGDYARERHTSTDSLTLGAIRKKAAARKKTRSR